MFVPCFGITSVCKREGARPVREIYFTEEAVDARIKDLTEKNHKMFPEGDEFHATFHRYNMTVREEFPKGDK